MRKRVGQVLEIATYRALLAVPGLEFYSRYTDLDAHTDAALYSKEEPPGHIGSRAIPGNKKLDFIVRHPTAGNLGDRLKNVREWIYPDRDEVTEML